MQLWYAYIYASPGFKWWVTSRCCAPLGCWALGHTSVTSPPRTSVGRVEATPCTTSTRPGPGQATSPFMTVCGTSTPRISMAARQLTDRRLTSAGAGRTAWKECSIAMPCRHTQMKIGRDRPPRDGSGRGRGHDKPGLSCKRLVQGLRLQLQCRGRGWHEKYVHVNTLI